MWENLLFSFLANLLIALIQPKPKLPQATQYTLKDFQLPTATEDRALPWGVGTFQINGNVIWYGDLQTEEVSKKVRVSLIKKVKQVVGYRYKVGMWLSCAGATVDSIKEIRYGEDLVWKGTQLLSATAATDVAVNFTKKDNEDDPVERGIVGIFRFFNQRVSEGATASVLPNPYMSEMLGGGTVPGYPNTCHCVFVGPSSAGQPYTGSTTSQTMWELIAQLTNTSRSMVGFVSNSNQIQNLTFTLYRMPRLTHIQTAGVELTYPVSGNTLDTGVSSAYYTHLANTQAIEGDANPAYVLLELLTTRVAGIGPKLSPHAINVSSFLQAGQTLFNEGLGVSFTWENTKSIEELTKQLLAVMRAELQPNERTGQLELSLLRASDPVKLAFTDSNIVSIGSFSRINLDEAPNQVVIPFIDREAGWIERAYPKTNEAGVKAAGSVITKEVSYLGVSRPAVATFLAARELASVAASVARVSFTGVLPSGMVLKPGDRITVQHTELGQQIVMRVVGARFATYENRRRVEIDAVEDVLRDGRVGSFFALPPSVMQVSTTPAQPKGFGFFTLAPFYFHGDDANNHLLYYATRSDSAPLTQSSYDLAVWSTPPTTEDEAEYMDDKQEFAAPVVLSAPPAVQSSQQTLSASVGAGAAYTIFRNNGLDCIALYGSEFVLVSATVASATATSASIVVKKRGLFGSMPIASSSTQMVLLYGYHIDTAGFPLDGAGLNLQSRYGKPEVYGPGGTLRVDDVSTDGAEKMKWELPAGTYTLQSQVGRPYPPGYQRLANLEGGTSSNPTVLPSLAGFVPVSWVHRNRLKQGYSDWFAGDAMGEEGVKYVVILQYYDPATMVWEPVKHSGEGVLIDGTSVMLENLHGWPSTGNVSIRLGVRAISASGVYADNDYDSYYLLQQP